MAVSLLGVEIKLRRAEEHRKAIDAAVRDFIEVQLHNSYRIHIDIDPHDTNWQLVKWAGLSVVDPMIGAIVGDFVHNVRSALDQLMWILVEANNGRPGAHTQWPISETEAQWRNDVANRDITERGLPPTNGISIDALKVVEDLQPFQMGRRLRSGAPLLRLLKMSNEDKHRTLHVAIPFPTEMGATPMFAPSGYLEITKVQIPEKPVLIQDGAILLRLKVRKVRWPPPEDIVVTMKPPAVGIHIGFFASGRFVAGVGHLPPMLAAAQTAHDAAGALPEMAQRC